MLNHAAERILTIAFCPGRHNSIPGRQQHSSTVPPRSTFSNMPPSKRASVKAMEAHFTCKIKEACGKGSMIVPAVRIETHFERESADDMVESNEMRILLCADGYGRETSFSTSALPVPTGERQDRTWYCHPSWQEPDLRQAYEGAGILSLLMPDPVDANVYYVVFKKDCGNISGKMHVVDESTKLLVKSITDPKYNLAGACATACGDKKFAVKRPRKDQLNEVFRMHMHQEKLTFFRGLFAADRGGGPKSPIDCLDPMAKAEKMDKDSAFVYVTRGARRLA